MEPDKQGFFRDMQRLAEDYIKERLLLMKLQAAEKAAELSAVIFASVIIGVFLFIILILLSLMACFFLANLTGNFYVGISLVILFYFLLIIMMVVFRKKLPFSFVSNGAIRLIFKNNDDNDPVS